MRGRLSCGTRSPNRPIVRIRVSPLCYTSQKGDIGLGGSPLVETAERPPVVLLPDHAPAGLALSRSSASTPYFPNPVRFRFGRARRTRETGLRHGVLQRLPSQLQPKIRQERAPGRPRLDHLLDVPMWLRTASRGVWHAFGESSRTSDRGHPGRPGVASANLGGLTARILRRWSRSL